MMDKNEGHNEDAIEAVLQRFVLEDAVGQLRRREGLMARLGSENGELKLDWVEGVARLLADSAKLEEVENEAWDIRQRGIRHIIWAGMGGSVIAVRVLTELGFCGEIQEAIAEHITIYPLDSTDPAALNAIVLKIASVKQLSLPATGVGTRFIASTNGERSDQAFLQALLGDVLMIGVSMGMTSEEPITHLTWFSELLGQAQLPMAEHLLVMTLPGSYLDHFARERGAPSRSLQLDGGTGTGGRMSAPTTRVFLLPAALALANLSYPSRQHGQLRAVLSRAWELYNLELATVRPAEHPFVQLAAAMSEASREGACFVLLRIPEGWQALLPWIEQLMEESLGKGDKGVVVFDDQTRFQGGGKPGPYPIRVEVVTDVVGAGGDVEIVPAQIGERVFVLEQPYLVGEEPMGRLVAVASCFLGWQLSMALYGYAQGITFAGQPAVENYKARTLRMQDDPLRVIEQWSSLSKEGILTLCMPEGIEGAINRAPTSVLARVLRGEQMVHHLWYLDVTVNGEVSSELRAVLDRDARLLGNELLGVPVKVRRAPAAYHSTEQSEMDGPPWLVSLRLLGRAHEPCVVGVYDDRFLRAQAVSTWQAMLEKGRTCFLLVVDGYLDDAIEPLTGFFTAVEQHLME